MLSANESWHADCFIYNTRDIKHRNIETIRADAANVTEFFEEDTMINLILWLLFGALVGWLASIVMRTDAQQGTILNIVVGIIGAMIGGFLLGGPTINSNTFNLTALLVSFVGAVVLLAIVNLVRRGSV